MTPEMSHKLAHEVLGPDAIATPVRAPVRGTPDELMEKASRALAAADYFDAERLADRALQKLLRARDFEQMSRVILPLQEARRQKRHEATDAGHRGFVKSLNTSTAFVTGCYLLEPPLVGVDTRVARGVANKHRVPVLILCKEPTTSAGKWPIVGVGTGEPFGVVVRVQVAPPAANTPDSAWYMATQELLGDTAIAKIKPEWPADHRVEDLMEYLEAVPDHEKLMQVLAETCREAARSPRSTTPRRRGMGSEFSF